MSIQTFTCQLNNKPYSACLSQRSLTIKNTEISYEFKISLDQHITWMFEGDLLVGFTLGGDTFYAELVDLLKLKIGLNGKMTYSGILDFYEFRQLLGVGANGKVGLLKCKVSNMNYAVKCIKKDSQTQTIDEIKNEIQLHSIVKHKNVASLVEVFTSRTNYYLVIEYLEDTLEVDYDHEDIKEIIKAILNGLIHIHQCGIIHRDIKLENIMVGANNEIKIIDFGLAMKKDKISRDRCGTPGYIAPEILTCTSKCMPYSFKSDVFSVGILMYQLYQKKHLIVGDQLDVLLTNNANFKLFNYEMPKLPDYGTDLLKMLLQEDPKLRYSCEEALNHPYFQHFDQECSIQVSPIMIPKFKGHITEKELSTPGLTRNLSTLNMTQ